MGEQLEQKYVILRNQVINIRNEVNELDNLYFKFYNSVKDGLLVNDDILYSDEFYLLHKTNINTINEINNRLIQMIDEHI